ncbi:valine--tRNA ligase, partial [Vibrio parahaemolyticus V-223/04]
VRSNTH